jgi:hypothetical protein
MLFAVTLFQQPLMRGRAQLWTMAFNYPHYPILSFYQQLQSTSRPLAHFSHKRMRYMHFWCTYNHITQKVGEWKDQGWKSGKYDWEWYATPFKEPLVVPLFPKSDNMILGCLGWPPR